MKTFRCFLTIIAFAIIAGSTMAQENKKPMPKKYIKVPAGYLMVLRQGENVLEEIQKLAVNEKIPSANYTGMGFVNVKFGFFNFKTKEYDPKDFNDVELVSMTGSIAWQNNKVSLHTHGVVSDKNFNTYGGHLLAASVGTGSVEILINVHDKPLERVEEQPLGANVLNLGH